MSYAFEYSIECPVSRDSAWRFWSDVENWAAVDPAVEYVKLDGPFAAGTKGMTKPRGSSLTVWSLVEVEDDRSAEIELSVPGAVLRFLWRFEDAASGGTLITQRVVLEGEGVDDYSEAMTGLEKGIPEGMRCLGRAMIRAANDAF